MGVWWVILAGSLSWLDPGAFVTSETATQTTTTVESSAERADDGARKQKLAQVKVEIREEDGEVIKHKELVPWRETSTIEIEGAGHTHSVTVTPAPVKKSMKLEMTFSYDRDDTAIVSAYSYESKMWKRELLRVEGGLAIAITVVPKTIELPPEPPKRDELEHDETEDPLGNLDL